MYTQKDLLQLCLDIGEDKVLLKHGWTQYEGGTWIKVDWITNSLPYDRMAMSKEGALRTLVSKTQQIPINMK